jgi:hypothetical protein
MLKQRIITALVLLPFALGGFFLLDGGLFALFIGRSSAWPPGSGRGLAGSGATAARRLCLRWWRYCWLACIGCRMLAPWVLLLAVVWWALATFLVMGYPGTRRYWASAPSRLLIGLLILLPAWQGLVLFKHWPEANLADSGGDGAGLGGGHRRLFFRAALWQAQVGARSQSWQELGRGFTAACWPRLMICAGSGRLP